MKDRDSTNWATMNITPEVFAIRPFSTCPMESRSVTRAHVYINVMQVHVSSHEIEKDSRPWLQAMARCFTLFQLAFSMYADITSTCIYMYMYMLFLYNTDCCDKFAKELWLLEMCIQSPVESGVTYVHVHVHVSVYTCTCTLFYSVSFDETTKPFWFSE